jgi:hypothetical protein
LATSLDKAVDRVLGLIEVNKVGWNEVVAGQKGLLFGGGRAVWKIWWLFG